MKKILLVAALLMGSAPAFARAQSESAMPLDCDVIVVDRIHDPGSDYDPVKPLNRRLVKALKEKHYRPLARTPHYHFDPVLKQKMNIVLSSSIGYVLRDLSLTLSPEFFAAGVQDDLWKKEHTTGRIWSRGFGKMLHWIEKDLPYCEDLKR